MSDRCWAIVPAAGVGRRMGGAVLKQYLDLCGRRIIDHTLERLLNHPRICGVCVALSAEDGYWDSCEYHNHPSVIRAAGGAERYHSVRNALVTLAESADQDDWVLVHDAARPCLSSVDLDRLIETLQSHPVGGLLGIPVADTLKRVDAANQVDATVSRERLWRAFTPQMFRLGLLQRCLEQAIEKGAAVTDEASAVELSGHRPLMVEGDGMNIKITHQHDLLLAEHYLKLLSSQE
ncbi:MAG: 2-C-methyl-D-erythritol 4-phosphate cytidylyltransferase [Candidatus Thiodiazotropha endolucinida]|nr:2-C-methyl-D-erythritol 4-phosphate cytidylyltransferase [Candidatus Thiodiazotropha taylori]MCW4242284.1 2-C-methyl-D-erythritol 4-phosphate cytidylyltransferase [Candidatus Thiodiazotropha taylori]